jgi:hypothetical protein
MIITYRPEEESQSLNIDTTLTPQKDISGMRRAPTGPKFPSGAALVSHESERTDTIPIQPPPLRHIRHFITDYDRRQAQIRQQTDENRWTNYLVDNGKNSLVSSIKTDQEAMGLWRTGHESHKWGRKRSSKTAVTGEDLNQVVPSPKRLAGAKPTLASDVKYLMDGFEKQDTPRDTQVIYMEPVSNTLEAT